MNPREKTKKSSSNDDGQKNSSEGSSRDERIAKNIPGRERAPRSLLF